MGGLTIGHATYIEGLVEVGRKKIGVTLEANPTYLSIIRHDDGSALVSVPWANIKEMKTGGVDKTFTEGLMAEIALLIPIIGDSRLADSHIAGLWIIYWDEAVQRDQRIFLGTGTNKNGKKLGREILRYKDEFFRTMGDNSGMQRR